MLLIIFIAKSLQKEQNNTNPLLWPQSAGINMQSPKSESTSRRLALIVLLCMIEKMIDFQFLAGV